MFIHNTDVAIIFNQIADVLEINGENPFRIRAYRNAARMLNTLATSVRKMVEEKQDLKSLPGIGVDLAGKIVEIVTTGKGVEVEINEDGALGLPRSILERLDLVIGAVHGKFTLSRER